MSSVRAQKVEARLATTHLHLTPEETASYLRVAASSLPIRRHYEIFLWLNGELQTFLPHQILIAAWGDFVKCNLKFDVTSGLPGVRTAQLARCRIDELVRDAYLQWVDGGREPMHLCAEESAIALLNCNCDLHGAIRRMRSCLIHGLRDERSGHESLYIALSETPASGLNERGRALAQLLFCQMDAAFRKVAALPLEEPASERNAELHGLSVREHEILDLLSKGHTNLDIAFALDISPYTVKNHVQRIFRKIGVKNRTQAAAKINEAARTARGN